MPSCGGAGSTISPAGTFSYFSLTDDPAGAPGPVKVNSTVPRIHSGLIVRIGPVVVGTAAAGPASVVIRATARVTASTARSAPATCGSAAESSLLRIRPEVTGWRVSSPTALDEGQWWVARAASVIIGSGSISKESSSATASVRGWMICRSAVSVLPPVVQ